ncbi:hypothetical protein BLA23254_05010 [Burkholderia lata]|uniref:Uncharacterized protein n=1 Tax=Burkholderia lata (strain ATCC 17760 / DSM 23089 / LMG 22485 / NCIMB 9086 / R18194 / 383) TaxID=482957 RepID=A0A6P2PD69_BURL3|nr:hypothetical protein [Burkholderia lata]VWC05313.1 hypothetical protein BLA23254_05010 [Burkholderia lata]
MDTSKYPQDLLERAAAYADDALLTAILKHISENRPEIVQLIVEDAISRVPPGEEFEGEKSFNALARELLQDRMNRVVKELTPPSNIESGFPRTVKKGY